MITWKMKWLFYSFMQSLTYSWTAAYIDTTLLPTDSVWTWFLPGSFPLAVNSSSSLVSDIPSSLFVAIALMSWGLHAHVATKFSISQLHLLPRVCKSTVLTQLCAATGIHFFAVDKAKWSPEASCVQAFVYISPRFIHIHMRSSLSPEDRCCMNRWTWRQ